MPIGFCSLDLPRRSAQEMQDPTPMINPPSSASEWGPLILNGSMYRVPCPVCAPVALFKNGVVQEMKTPDRAS
jgi:hypothetical protein